MAEKLCALRKYGGGSGEMSEIVINGGSGGAAINLQLTCNIGDIIVISYYDFNSYPRTTSGVERLDSKVTNGYRTTLYKATSTTVKIQDTQTVTYHYEVLR